MSQFESFVPPDWIGDGEDEDIGVCDRCGGEGYILASDGDGSDWQEDTYAGPEDAMIKCRCCKNGAAL